MKNVKQAILVVLLGASLIGNQMFAQKAKTKQTTKETTPPKPDEAKQALVTVTTMHRNMDHKGTAAEWKALEKEYFDKVTSKNELVIGHQVLSHYFTADNSEILMVSIYGSWDDIEKSAERNNELVKAAWPDEKARKDFFEKRSAFYTNDHSDEIYQNYPGMKRMAAAQTKPMLFYIRKSHFSFPKDGTEKDFSALYNEYLTAVTYKNDVVKAFYPSIHAWGSDRTEFNEVYVVDSLGDIEKMFDKDEELFKGTWTDEAKRKEYNGKVDKYFTGIHGDYIYQSVPELAK